MQQVLSCQLLCGAQRSLQPFRKHLQLRHLVKKFTAESHSATKNLHGVQKLNCLEDREWLLDSPHSKVRTITLTPSTAAFRVIQDDLLHPILGGNKLRKLDALLPELTRQGVTDIVTCGGVQSAHTAAVAAACAEQGLRAHLLLRGERPAVPTGFTLLARMFGRVTHVTRSEYSNRAEMLARHKNAVAQEHPEGKVHILPEGAADPFSLLGLVRLVHYLAASEVFDWRQACTFVVDSGTGTTATGLAIGVSLLGLPWEVIGITLAGPISYYEQQQADLSEAFQSAFSESLAPLPLVWKERAVSRKFGRVYPEEIATCKEIAREHGVLLDPIYTLAAWEMAADLAQKSGFKGDTTATQNKVVMLHTGGAAGLHGLSQRFPECF